MVVWRVRGWCATVEVFELRDLLRKFYILGMTHKIVNKNINLYFLLRLEAI